MVLLVVMVVIAVILIVGVVKCDLNHCLMNSKARQVYIAHFPHKEIQIVLPNANKKKYNKNKYKTKRGNRAVKYIKLDKK